LDSGLAGGVGDELQSRQTKGLLVRTAKASGEGRVAYLNVPEKDEVAVQAHRRQAFGLTSVEHDRKLRTREISKLEPQSVLCSTQQMTMGIKHLQLGEESRLAKREGGEPAESMAVTFSMSEVRPKQEHVFGEGLPRKVIDSYVMS
jgi:hypothetical protein